MSYLNDILFEENTKNNPLITDEERVTFRDLREKMKNAEDAIRKINTEAKDGAFLELMEVLIADEPSLGYTLEFLKRVRLHAIPSSGGLVVYNAMIDGVKKYECHMQNVWGKHGETAVEVDVKKV